MKSFVNQEEPALIDRVVGLLTFRRIFSHPECHMMALKIVLRKKLAE